MNWKLKNRCEQYPTVLFYKKYPNYFGFFSSAFFSAFSFFSSALFLFFGSWALSVKEAIIKKAATVAIIFFMVFDFYARMMGLINIKCYSHTFITLSNIRLIIYQIIDKKNCWNPEDVIKVDGKSGEGAKWELFD